MNKRELMPVALEVCAIILQRALDNAEHDGLSPLDNFEGADLQRIDGCIQDIIDGLQCRADRLETGLTR